MQTSSIHGASPEEWQHFAVSLGLVSDLLPVVSNPNAKVSPRSKMRDIGKTPSRYTNDREVVGIPAWTTHKSTERDVLRWQRDADLGICLQTRIVRAIDIDIPDAGAAQAVRDVVEMVLGGLPMRSRGNSGKCLFAFKLEGSYTKRILRTASGPIEFLADGQQFIASGTHPSGARYEWAGGLPAEIPHVTPAEFEALWSALEQSFGIAGTVTRRAGVRLTEERRAEAVASDDVLAFLERTGWVRSFDSQGRAHITCPWAHEHSDGGEGSESATTYFPRGVGGFEQGHFRCLHAHCEGRTDGDYLDAVGYVLDDFAVVEPQPGDTEVPPLLPAFERTKSGEILATVGNVEMALRRADVCAVHIGYDSFRDEVMVAAWGTAEWRQFTDADYTRLRIRLEAGGFKPIGRELIRDVVGLVAEEKQFDSAKLWLDGIAAKWDGVSRVETFWQRYFGVEASEYARACGFYIWTAMAGRVLEPGVKVDMVPILVGGQGVGKTTGVAAMVPSTEHFMEVKLDEDETTLARKMRGKLVGEIGELRGLHSREIEHIKAFVTRTHEEWVPKFKEFSMQFPRRLVFIGTTNNDEFLADETGNRRWLPMRVGEVDRDALAADRDQLWAEGAVLFANGGVQFGKAQALAQLFHADHTLTDPWDETVAQWLLEADFGGAGLNRDKGFTSSHVLRNALGFSASGIKRSDEMRVAKILKRMGFVNSRLVKDGHKVRIWELAKNSEFVEVAKNNELEGLV